MKVHQDGLALNLKGKNKKKGYLQVKPNHYVINRWTWQLNNVHLNKMIKKTP